MDLVRILLLAIIGLTGTGWSDNGLFPLSPVLFAADGLDAADESEPTTHEGEPPAAPNPDARFKLQIGDEEPIPLDPIHPEDSAHKNRRRAITWQLAGQLHLTKADVNREELKTAEECFRQAIAADPSFIRSYQMLVGLLLSGTLNDERIDEARKVAFQAAEHSSEGFTLIRQLAGLLARSQADQGTTLLTDALNTPHLPPDSVIYYQIQRDLGLFYRLSSQSEKAAECYQKVFAAVAQSTPPKFTSEQIQQIATDPAALFDEMGQVFLSVKKPDLALAAFQKAAEARGGDSVVHSFNLAQVFRDTGQPNEALSELEKYLDAQLQSKGRMAYQLLKDLLTDLKRDEELVERLEQLRTKDPQNSALRYFLAEQYVVQKRFAEAETAILNGQTEIRDPVGSVGLIPVYRGLKKYEQLLTLMIAAKGLPDPEQVSAQTTIEPEFRQLVNRYDQERQALTKDAVAMDGLVKYGREQLQGDEPRIQFAQAWVLGKLCGLAERTDDARDFYRQAIEMQNDPPFQLYSELGQVLLDADRYDDAIAIFRECADHPSSGLQDQRWRSLYLLSYAYEFAGKTDDAISVATEAKTLAEQAGLGDIAAALLHAQIGWIYYHSHNLDSAIKVYEEVIQKYARNKQTERTLEGARFSLSAIYVLQGEMSKGESILEEILASDPENTQANNDLGYLWADQGKNLEKAQEMIAKALAAEPENPAYLDSLGWVLFKLGRTQQAIENLERAVGLKRGDDPTLHDHLGDCYVKAGRADDAKQVWTKALELMDKKKSNDEKLRKSLKQKLGLPAN